MPHSNTQRSLKTCAVCGGEFDPTRRAAHSPSRAKYCSLKCKGLADVGIRRPAYAVKLHTGTIGALSEIVIASDLMRRGYHIFRAMSPASPFDLVAVNNDQMLRIEVRTGKIQANGDAACTFTNQDEGRSDVLAIVLMGTEIVYWPPLIDSHVNAYDVARFIKAKFEVSPSEAAEA